MKGQIIVSATGAFAIVVGLLGLVGYEIYLGFLISRSDPESLQRLTVSIYAANIGLTMLLVIATAVYAFFTFGILKSTAKQANATSASVAEMQRQRQDAFLPVLDILQEPLFSPSFNAREGWRLPISLEKGKLPDRLQCRIRNVGVGPALHVRYQIILGEETRTLTEDSVMPGCEFVPPEMLAISSLDTSGHICITYRDVFGRECTSKKDALADFGQNTFDLGPLQFNVQ